MSEYRPPTHAEVPGLKYLLEALSYNWHGMATAAPSSAVRYLLSQYQGPSTSMFDPDIDAVMQQAQRLAAATPETADAERAVLREMLADLVAKAAG
ncbi:hypothetical protein [Pseudomonas knackmussii]|uniref:hypothetical protein n=1 Tax=Pseudomonas knackmussii TaxID=65741 RepID=UPI0013638DD9|nr:hypothetical protein [Pseudomonas knackmussii]